MFWITLPFLGAEAAAAERERVRHRAKPALVAVWAIRSFCRIGGFTNRARVVV